MQETTTKSADAFTKADPQNVTLAAPTNDPFDVTLATDPEPATVPPVDGPEPEDPDNDTDAAGDSGESGESHFHVEEVVA